MMILLKRLFFTPPGPTGRRVFSTRFCRVKSIDDDDDDDDDESVVAIIFQASEEERERISKALFLSLFFNNPPNLINNVHLLLNYLLSKLFRKVFEREKR
jgi:hypothetical protein|tara:strand:- start:424 stop:723 length:300 start_codon:yes stop_codon:yes gene_type:complete